MFFASLFFALPALNNYNNLDSTVEQQESEMFCYKLVHGEQKTALNNFRINDTFYIKVTDASSEVAFSNDGANVKVEIWLGHSYESQSYSLDQAQKGFEYFFDNNQQVFACFNNLTDAEIGGTPAIKDYFALFDTNINAFVAAAKGKP